MDQDGVSVPKVTYSFVSCAGRATVVGLSVCLSVCLFDSTILALQATWQHKSDTNSFGVASIRKIQWQYR